MSGVVWAQGVILKIPVTRDGVYRITYNDLGYYGQPYGVDPKQIDPRQIHIYNRDRDVAIHVSGEEDGQFNPGDYIEFYGVPVVPGDPEYKYTEENVYWLKVSSDTPVRMPFWENPVAGTPEPHFLHTYHAERNWIYWETMPNGVGLDHWFWGRKILKGEGQDYTFYLSNIASTTLPATVRVYLHGRTDDVASPDHQTRVTLNGTILGDIVWDGQRHIIHSFDKVPHSLLMEGANTIRFDEIENPDVIVDSIFVNWIEVDYYKSFVAEGDRLKFTARGNGDMGFSISNFSSSIIDVFDVSDPYQPRRLTNPTVTPSGSTYTVKFSDNISGEATYLSIATPDMKGIPFIFVTDPSTLKDTNIGADYIIITHDDLKDAVSPLAEHRKNNGYRVKVVTTREIYDEFSGGIFTPLAIKDFLKYAYKNWRPPAPEFVLLVGDANVDYKDNWKTGQINYVPTYLVETTIIGETPSDHWFVTVSGDDPLPDMFIGRIPAKTAGEVGIVVNKIIDYETDTKGDWRYRIAYAANDQDPRFEEYSEEWAAYLPGNYSPGRIYVSQYGDKTQPKVDLIKNLNDGVLITSFFGHGSVDLWASTEGTKLFTSDDAASLTNQGKKYPFVTAFNCLNGLFAMPNEGTRFELPDGSSILFSVPLPEALLHNEEGGALAMWSPSAFAYPSEQRWIGHELFSGLFKQGNNILGSVTTQAKVNAYVKKGIYVENLDVFTFFGDPATRLSLDIKKNNPSSGSGGGGCFIATAVYGSYLHPHVRVLRDFRDRFLLQTAWGEKFVEAYYTLSPPVAEWISERGWARGISQVILIPIIFGAWVFVSAPGWLIVVILGLTLFSWTVIFTVNRHRRFTALIFIVLLFSSMIGESTVLALPADNDLRVIRSDENGLLIELVLPPFGVTRNAIGKTTYDQVMVQDYGLLSKIGRPEVPMRGMLIAIPEGAKVLLSVTADDYDTRWLHIGPPVPPGDDSVSPAFDQEVYQKNAFFPGPLAAVGFTGYMRDQKVIQILFYPVQYNPVSGEVRIYKRIQVSVDFGSAAQVLKKPSLGKNMGDHSGAGVSDAYERLLRGLILNYPQ